MIGPETALEAGVSDALRAAGTAVFGPSRAAVQIETSKVFAKNFMARHHIPTAHFAAFQDVKAAHAHLETVDYPLVLKASGLAAGKGVLLPASLSEAHAALDSLMLNLAFGEAGREVVIEERLEGEEISLLAFCDGNTLSLMPAAQDHKRLLDGDLGPNTGGMGAYAPAPAATPEILARALREVLQPAVDGLREEGLPFRGVLYAGLMLTAAGPKVLEFNARFGDPETQVILPLLASDLLDVLEACALGRLDEVDVRWREGAAACVVLAAPGYPDRPQSGQAIYGLETPLPDGAVFHAGTARRDGQWVTAGGRVLGVTCWAADLPAAVQAAYRAVENIHFDGRQYRRDIAARAFKAAPSAYAAAGVNIDAGNRAVTLMSQAVRSTYTPAVLAGIGAFGGLFDAAALGCLREPVLVASTDGVGTKVKLAAQLGRYGSIGADLVNHCINDILVQGARPLFFLDYFASAQIDPEIVAAVVGGLAAACRESGVALLGGETAEMPGVYQPGEFDLAGTIVGALERERRLPRAALRPGDVLIGLRSSGPHTNGYSLIRRIFTAADLNAPRPELGGSSLGDALLAPHRSYFNLLIGLIEQSDSPILALAHLTGGGFIENIPRVLPQGLGARIRRGSWPVPPLFQIIQREGNISSEEMHRVFNMGIGMVIAVAPERAVEVQAALPEESWIVGELVFGEHKVELA